MLLLFAFFKKQNDPQTPPALICRPIPKKKNGTNHKNRNPTLPTPPHPTQPRLLEPLLLVAVQAPDVVDLLHALGAEGHLARGRKQNGRMACPNKNMEDTKTKTKPSKARKTVPELVSFKGNPKQFIPNTRARSYPTEHQQDKRRLYPQQSRKPWNQISFRTLPSCPKPRSRSGQRPQSKAERAVGQNHAQTLKENIDGMIETKQPVEPPKRPPVVKREPKKRRVGVSSDKSPFKK